jgi:MFS transporter, DHA2 family, methylenomycin A resistance protein
LFTLALAIAAVSESKNSQGRYIDLPGQVLAALFLIALTCTAIESQAWGWRSPLSLGGLVFAHV